MFSIDSLEKILTPYRSRFEEEMTQALPSFGEKTLLREACEYALKSGGKRIRPAIVYMMAESLKENDVADAALAVEFFHTASLIADDLPCMDNEEQRRGLPSLHKAYGETTAILASYSLIAAAYDRIRLNAEKLNRGDQVCILALKHTTESIGIRGITGGQFFDLFPPPLDEKKTRAIMDMKTGALFRLCFVLGWLFGGGNPSSIPLVQTLASHFGLAFQIMDDFQDFSQDTSDKGSMNYVAVVGKEKAKKALLKEFSLLQENLEKLSLTSSKLALLLSLFDPFL